MSAVIETHDHDDHHHGPAEGLTVGYIQRIIKI